MGKVFGSIHREESIYFVGHRVRSIRREVRVLLNEAAQPKEQVTIRFESNSLYNSDCISLSKVYDEGSENSTGV